MSTARSRSTARAAALCVCVLSMPASAPAAPPRFNVLLIVADDLNTDLGCYDHPLVKSPAIDRLAARGMRFDRAFCQYPLCNPSRASFLSGRRPESIGVFDNDTDPRKNLVGVELLPEYFHQRGYVTAHVGKVVHTGWETRVAWDFEFPRPQPRPVPASQTRRGEGASGAKPDHDRAPAPSIPPLEWGPTRGAELHDADLVAARQAVRMMKQCRDRPFLMAVGFQHPHEPFHAPPRFGAMYPPQRVLLPFAPLDDRDDIPKYALLDFVQTSKFTVQDVREVLAAYYASISFLDAQVDVLLEGLEQLGLADTTIVVFLSDHGLLMGEHRGAWRKLSLFEPCVRVPLIVRAPGHAGGVCRRPVELVDLFPTLTDLCGLPAPDGMEGASLAPLLDDPDQPWKRAAFTVVQRVPLGSPQRRRSPASRPSGMAAATGSAPIASKADATDARGPRFGYTPATRPVAGGLLAFAPPAPLMGRSVRTERYRYTEWGDPTLAELYDHEVDPGEFHNRANDPAAATVVAEMQRILAAGWRGALPPKPTTASSRP